MTLEQELIEFCTEPRCITEITDFLELEDKDKATSRFTTQLIKEGKLKFIHPENPKCIHQRYLKADVEYSEEMQARAKELEKTDRHLEVEQMTLEFCKVPRTLGEIKDHVGLVGYDTTRKRAVQPLIEQGKLKLFYPHNPLYQHQKYVVAESEEGYPSFTEKEILEYCKTPRSKVDIKDYFGIGQDLLYKVLNPLRAQGKIKYAKATRIGNEIIYKRIVTNDSPQEPVIERPTPSDDEIIEYCKSPRYCYEIIEEFRINDYTCRKLVNRLLKEERLKYTPEVVKRHRKLMING